MNRTIAKSSLIAFCTLLATSMAAQSQTYAPCPELERFMSQTSPLYRQLMAANDEFYPVTHKMQVECERRENATQKNAYRSKIGKKAANAEDRQRMSASSDRGEYVDLGKQ